MEVLAADLDRSGLFRLLDRNSFLADPREGTDPRKIDFSRWMTVGAQGLVKAVASVEGDKVVVEFHLYDPARAAEQMHGTYDGPSAGQRQIAHRFADDLVRFFTQEPGDFQTRIAYVRKTESGKQIVVADSDGHGPQPLTGAAINILPAWAPDGRAIAFTSFRDNAAHLYLVDVLSQAVKPLVMAFDFATGAVYAPDGRRFAFCASVEGNTDIYLSSPERATPGRLTDSKEIDVNPSFSPDGKQIAFISERTGQPQVYVMDAEGSRPPHRITFQGNWNQEPAWSPKGDLIAFSGRDEHRSYDIYTVHLPDGKVTRLTQNAGTNEKPAWSPNGRPALRLDPRRHAAGLADDRRRPQPASDHPREDWRKQSGVGPVAALTRSRLLSEGVLMGKACDFGRGAPTWADRGQGQRGEGFSGSRRGVQDSKGSGEAQPARLAALLERNADPLGQLSPCSSPCVLLRSSGSR
jgi:TolB protein